jgi:hypothetical protein
MAYAWHSLPEWRLDPSLSRPVQTIIIRGRPTPIVRINTCRRCDSRALSGGIRPPAHAPACPYVSCFSHIVFENLIHELGSDPTFPDWRRTRWFRGGPVATGGGRRHRRRPTGAPPGGGGDDSRWHDSRRPRCRPWPRRRRPRRRPGGDQLHTLLSYFGKIVRRGNPEKELAPEHGVLLAQ